MVWYILTFAGGMVGGILLLCIIAVYLLSKDDNTDTIYD